MKSTLLGGLCIILSGIIVGQLLPKGSLTNAVAGVVAAPATSTHNDAAFVSTATAELNSAAGAMPAPSVQAISAPQPPITAPQPVVPTPQPLKAPAAAATIPAPAAQSIDSRCAALTEAARQSYLSAGYATQEFASTSIAAKGDMTTNARLHSARDHYKSALDDAHARIAAASRAQCWSHFAMEPPNLTPFTTSLPDAATAALVQ